MHPTHLKIVMFPPYLISWRLMVVTWVVDKELLSFFSFFSWPCGLFILALPSLIVIVH
jgi:hypothetical protein